MYSKSRGKNVLGIEVNLLRYSDLREDIVKEWADLEARATDGNPYLSPYFVLPSIKYLTNKNKPKFLVVRNKINNANELIGLGVFEYSMGTRRFPLPHLKSYRNPHSYLGGLLIDDDYMQVSLDAIFEYIRFKRNIFGIEFKNIVDATDICRQIDRSRVKYEMISFPDRKKNRAILIPNKVSEDYIKTNYSGKHRKLLQRQYRYLSELGDVRWNVVYGREVNERVIEQFLRLEHMGWKRDEGTSLLSSPSNENFFREMIRAFSRNDRVFFTELRVNNQVIASTSNLISSNKGYAFKIGWDPEFSQASPGILNEFEFIKVVKKLFPNLDCIDSGAEEGSFIDKIWHDRYAIRSEMIAKKYIASSLIKLLQYINSIVKDN